MKSSLRGGLANTPRSSSALLQTGRFPRSQPPQPSSPSLFGLLVAAFFRWCYSVKELATRNVGDTKQGRKSARIK